MFNAKGLGKQFAQGAMDKVAGNEKVWQRFECFGNHEFAVAMPQNVSPLITAQILGQTKCPVCQTQSIKMKGVL